MKHEYAACILKPRGPFHVGDREGMREWSDVFIHSDTLFSALCHSYLLLHGRDGKTGLDAFLTAMQDGEPPLRISSVFPFWKETFYFPIPHNQQPPNKDTRRVRFLPQAAFDPRFEVGAAADAGHGRHPASR
uniref:CRISPR system Cms protein Csm4 n=1 Tax=candidate division WOR-3 bacterium TaxID=2052148 RepID=A0A7C4GIT0_UNCW3